MNKRPGRELANVDDRLAELRSRILALKSKVEASESAYVDRATAIKRIDEHIAKLAAAANDQSPALAFMYADERGVELLNSYRLERGVERLLAWIDPEAMRKRLVAFVDEQYAKLDPSAALSAEERAATHSQAAADLFAAEVEEERLIVAAEASGIHINRRGDANPAAILAA